jgi:phage terminase small subunit
VIYYKLKRVSEGALFLFSRKAGAPGKAELLWGGKGGRVMTANQRKFADEYLIDCNATRAYKAAYPNIKNDRVAEANGTRLLSKAKVKGYVEGKLDEISGRKIAKAVEVMEYLTSVMRGESEAEIVVVEGAGDGVSRARRIEKTPDEKERLKAAELLAKRYGLLTDKLSLDGGIKVVFSGESELDSVVTTYHPKEQGNEFGRPL